MCGLAGLIHHHGGRDNLSTAMLMGASLRHRGPDGTGSWSDADLGVAFDHRRLAVLDLSEAGQQPMHSPTGRYVIAFNGEIYNHLELRRQLLNSGQAPAWRGHSDTETLLSAIEAWGLQHALSKAQGMWALALVDRRERTLHLARDRFGEKPLYYGLHGQGVDTTFRFASELAAFAADPRFPRELDRFAADAMLRLGYVPAPFSIYAGVVKLPPGHLLTLPLRPEPLQKLPDTMPWWRFHNGFTSGIVNPLEEPDVALEALETALTGAIARQSLADVPLGCFLSGGIDSSLVAALMQREASQPIRTFTIGFESNALDESGHAAAVARHLGTEHTTAQCTSADALAIVPTLASHHAEPFADPSLIPTQLLCRQARLSGLTVCLSGDGGDELFGGYSRYSQLAELWRRWQSLPASTRRWVATGANQAERLTSVLHQGRLQRRISRAATTLSGLNTSLFKLRQSSCSWWGARTALVRQVPRNDLDAAPFWCGEHQHFTLDGADPRSVLMALDAIGYLPDDLLVKVDRAAMAVGLETRAPFLDGGVAEVALRCPASLHFRDGQGKWLLRSLLSRYVPPALTDRPKAGFNPPLGPWLRGQLRPWASDLLSQERLQRQSLLEPQPILRCWADHLGGRSDQSTRLWPVLMLQAWLDHWMPQ
jgi:asparagine synthase (glutamine-hydrolysing)